MLKVNVRILKVDAIKGFETREPTGDYKLSVEGFNSDGFPHTVELKTRQSGVEPGLYSGILTITSGVIKATNKPWVSMRLSRLEKVKA